MKRSLLSLFVGLAVLETSRNALGTEPTEVQKLESRIRALERELDDQENKSRNLKRSLDEQKQAVRSLAHDADTPFAVFLFGMVTALWAQNTKRNAWIWFFFGFLLAPVAGLVMLFKNSQDKARVEWDLHRQRRGDPEGFPPSP